MNAKIKKKIHKITDLCLNAKDFGHDCFLGYHPHVQQIELHTHKNGWIDGHKSDDRFKLYLDEHDVETKLDEMIQYLENLIEES